MIKKILKKIPGFYYITQFRLNRNFREDKKFFNKNYMYSKPITKEKLEYDMLFEIHKLEKGFAAKNSRPFGNEKIERIIKDILEYEDHNYPDSFSYNLAYSALDEYLKFYEKKEWTEKEEYNKVKSFMNNKKFKHIPVGAFNYMKKDYVEEINNMNYDKFISSRRSVRNFAAKKLSTEDITNAIKSAIKTPTACNRQMCKIYYIKSNDGKRVIEKYAQGLGLFELDNANYFVVTFDISANYFIGERNQGWFNAGLVTMNFVNALHSLKIGSCCIQFGNSFQQELEFKKLLKIPKSERIAVIITAGYYDEVSRIPYSTRKPIDEIYKEI